MSRLTRPQRALRALIGVLTVLVVAHLAAGWYYASQIHADALDASTPWQWEKNLIVNDAYLKSGDKGSVTLIEDKVVNEEARTAGTYGLLYDGGFGLLTGKPKVVDRRITRTFTLVSGKPPQIGQHAAIDFFAFPAEPIAPAKEVTYPGPLGELSGVLHPGKTGTWMILVHGRGSSPDEMYRQMAVADQLGMPSLSIRYRGDAGVDQDPSKEHGFGTTEWKDLAAAIDYAHSNGATDIVLSGSSMGGAVVAAYLREAKQTDDIRAVVLDSPLLSLEQTIDFNGKQMSIAGGLPIPPTVVWLAKRITSWRYGLDWDAADYLSDTSWLKVPTLIFHGDADTTVPISTSRQLAKAKSDLVTLEVVPGARHVQSWNADPAAYDETLAGFIAAHTG